MNESCLFCRADVADHLALCNGCQETLRIALVNVAAFHTDVLRIQPGQRVRVRSAYQSTPPPDVRAKVDPISRVVGDVDSIVIGWVRNLEDDRPGIDTPPATIVGACGWLERHVASIATVPWAGECLREIIDCERRLQKLIDKSDTGMIAGICGNEVGRVVEDDELVVVTCPRMLYRTESSTWVTCPECGRTWPAEERRQIMRAQAQDEKLPVRELAKVVVSLTDEKSQEKLTRRMEQWVHRGRLLPCGVRVVNGKPRQTYRVGDAMTLMLPPVKTDEAEAC